MIKKRACTAVTNGTVTDLKSKGLDFPTIITVEYQVGSEKYSLSESVKMKNGDKIKAGNITVGTQRVPVMGETRVGTAVTVMYNPEAPEIAYLPDNKGIANV